MALSPAGTPPPNNPTAVAQVEAVVHELKQGQVLGEDEQHCVHCHMLLMLLSLVCTSWQRTQGLNCPCPACHTSDCDASAHSCISCRRPSLDGPPASAAGHLFMLEQCHPAGHARCQDVLQVTGHGFCAAPALFPCRPHQQGWRHRVLLGRWPCARTRRLPE
jgi:hypothetical protein